VIEERSRTDVVADLAAGRYGNAASPASLLDLWITDLGFGESSTGSDITMEEARRRDRCDVVYVGEMDDRSISKHF
jgi:hypothetical protein